MRILRSGAATPSFAVTAVLVVGGLVAWVAGADAAARGLWIAATAVGLLFASVTTLRAALAREPTVDVIAILALVGALIVDEPFAGAVVALMLASGQLLEERARHRATRDLSLLIERAPRTARILTSAGANEVPVSTVRPGDRLAVGSGEVVAVDGRLLGSAVLDESALTGESLPVERVGGEDVRSGVVNAGAPLELVATAGADESTYAGIVRLVQQAQARSAPFVREADRLAVLFVPLTLVVAGAAWAFGGDLVRAVAVLVVATPCPLLLAAPIAVISGVSRAARAGVVMKGGAALESLAGGRVLLFDKTGTLTLGRPVLVDVVVAGAEGDADEVLRLAASVDQLSPHVLASAIVSAATRRGLDLSLPADVHEAHGYGLEGTVDGRLVRLGKAAWVTGDPADEPAWVRGARRRAALDSALTVFVAADDGTAGALLLSDPLRPEAPRMVRTLRSAGVQRVAIVTGDRADVAESVGRLVSADQVYAGCDPAQKLAVIEAESSRAPSVMVGDGVNDAPALAAAGTGVALAARGATASSEAADVVLTVDRIDALADAMVIARRSKAIARQAVLVGMGLSLAAMAAAAVGLLPPAAGAVLQEGIDVLAIGLALRALLPGRPATTALTAAESAVAREMLVEHESVLPVIERIRVVADALSTQQPDTRGVRELIPELQDRLVAHERAEEQRLVPIVARALGGAEATAGLSRSHAEIEQQVVRLRRFVDGLGEEVGARDVIELRRQMYGLYAVARLHNAQEEEAAFSLVPHHQQ